MIKLDFKPSQWYKFDTEELQTRWLMLAYQHIDEDITITEFLQCYGKRFALKLEFGQDNTATINYRTTFHPKMEDSVIPYNPNPCDGGSLIFFADLKKPVKKFALDDPMNNIMEMISKTQTKEIDAIIHDINEAQRKVIETSSNTKELFGLVKTLNEKYSIQIDKNIVEHEALELLSPEEQARLTQCQIDRKSKMEELNARYKELRTLMAITDTYEQRIQLLVTYGIIPAPQKI